METKITVYDGGKEIGDLDILRHLDDGIDRFRRVGPCDHPSTNAELARNSEVVGDPRLTTVGQLGRAHRQPRNGRRR